jgi:hypothetical protein
MLTCDDPNCRPVVHVTPFFIRLDYYREKEPHTWLLHPDEVGHMLGHVDQMRGVGRRHIQADVHRLVKRRDFEPIGQALFYLVMMDPAFRYVDGLTVFDFAWVRLGKKELRLDYGKSERGDFQKVHMGVVKEFANYDATDLARETVQVAEEKGQFIVSVFHQKVDDTKRFCRENHLNPRLDPKRPGLFFFRERRHADMVRHYLTFELMPDLDRIDVWRH